MLLPSGWRPASFMRGKADFLLPERRQGVSHGVFALSGSGKQGRPLCIAEAARRGIKGGRRKKNSATQGSLRKSTRCGDAVRASEEGTSWKISSLKIRQKCFSAKDASGNISPDWRPVPGQHHARLGRRVGHGLLQGHFHSRAIRRRCLERFLGEEGLLHGL